MAEFPFRRLILYNYTIKGEREEGMQLALFLDLPNFIL